MNRAVKTRELLVLILLFPIALHAFVLSGIGVGNPVASYSGLQTGVTFGPAAGLPHIDPSIGTSFQPLGRKSAAELLSGKLPWWDPDEGIGVPLAGGMIAASFFPLTILQALPDGQTVIDVIVQMMAGLFTFLLLRRLNLSRLASTTAALLFECNGTFAWLGAGWCYPMPFIPLLLYGVEMVFSAALRERLTGSIVIAVAVALSITAAMIEIAYLNGLLCVTWALVRLASRSVTETAKRAAFLSLGTLTGLALASPLILAFADYLSVSAMGSHGVGNRYSPLTESVIPQTFLPYVWGPIFYLGNPDLLGLWGGAGGYAGTALTVLAVCGVFGRFLRPLRIALAGWIVVTYTATIGVWFAQFLVTSIPGVRFTAYNRYFDSSREFALAVLVALFIHDVRNGTVDVRRYAVATALFVVVVAQGLFESPSLVERVLASPMFVPWFWGSIAVGAAVIGAIWIAFATLRRSRRYALVLATIVVGEAALEAFLPTTSFPTSSHVNVGPVKFLQAHLGLQRFYELGPIAPSFGSYFDIAELNTIGFLSSTWENYITAKLDPFVDPQGFDGISPAKGPGVPGRDEILRANVGAFENVGVRYVVSVAGSRPLTPVAGDWKPAAADAAKARLVYRDSLVDVDELPAPAPYFSAANCRLQAIDRERVRAKCSQNSTLVRRELSVPGWSARVNDVARDVATAGIFQTVALAPGEWDVAFDFLPVGMPFAYVAFGFAILSIVAMATAVATIDRRRGTSRR